MDLVDEITDELEALDGGGTIRKAMMADVLAERLDSPAALDRPLWRTGAA